MTRSSQVQVLPPPPTISSDLEIDGKPGCEARLPPFSASVVASAGCWVEHPGCTASRPTFRGIHVAVMTRGLTSLARDLSLTDRHPS